MQGLGPTGAFSTSGRGEQVGEPVKNAIELRKLATVAREMSECAFDTGSRERFQAAADEYELQAVASEAKPAGFPS